MQKHQLEITKWRGASKLNLMKERAQLKDQYTHLKVSLSLQKEKNTAEVKKMRRKIARINTILHEDTKNVE